MYSIIKEIFSDSGYISENAPVTKEHKNIVKKLYACEEKIKKYLPKNKADKLIWDYSFLQGELNSEIESTSFAEGFKAGLLLSAEVFCNADKND